MAESGSNGYIIQAKSGVTWTAVWWKKTFTFGSESTFFVENKTFPFVWIPQRRINNLWGPIYSISRAPKKSNPLSLGLNLSFDSIYVGTWYLWGFTHPGDSIPFYCAENLYFCKYVTCFYCCFLWRYIATNLLFLQHCFYDLRSTGRHGPNESQKTSSL